MERWHYIFMLTYLTVSLLVFAKSFWETKYHKNAFGLTRWLLPIGIFVWGDGVVFGLFWAIVAVACLLLGDFNLFLFIYSTFWIVRAWGEVVYWINEQFAVKHRNPVDTLPFKSIFHNDSIWFVHQIVWQSVAVLAVVFSVYYGWQWLYALSLK